jgi:hypothetical protein
MHHNINQGTALKVLLSSLILLVLVLTFHFGRLLPEGRAAAALLSIGCAPAPRAYFLVEALLDLSKMKK